MDRKTFALLVLMCLVASSEFYAHNINATVKADSVLTHIAASSDTVSVDTSISPPKATVYSGVLGKIIKYFEESNTPKPQKKFDVNFIGGPHYATDIKFGLGVVGACQYRLKGTAQTLQPSNVSLYGDVSTVGFYLIGIKGTQLFPDDKYRVNYHLSFYSFPTFYWGIGYENGDNDANEVEMKRKQIGADVEFLMRVKGRLFVGIKMMLDYVDGVDVSERLDLFNGQDLKTINYGLGLTMQYDTRDVMTNATKGVYVSLTEMFRPRFLWNSYAFTSTKCRFSAYKRVWNGGVVACDCAIEINFGNPSWAMMAKLGEDGVMRGYYEGRYRDKGMIAAQMELRQNVWRRCGCVAWIGAGNVFHDVPTIRKTLPNFGFGLRWEFKKNMNIRIDYGFGKSGQKGFIIGVNEAF